MRVPTILGVLAFMLATAHPAAAATRPDPRQRAYALIDEERAEFALGTGDVVLLEDALATAQTRYAALPPLSADTPADDLVVHLGWQLFWYRLRALGTSDDTNLYARELAFLARFPDARRLEAVRASFRQLFQARQLMAAHPQISTIAHAQHADFTQDIEAYAPRFAMTTASLAKGRLEPLVGMDTVYASRWADAQWQRSREALHRDPAAVLAAIHQHDLARDDLDLARAAAVDSRAQALYLLNRVKVRALVLQEAVNLLHSDPRLQRLVDWYEARGPLYRDPRAGGLVAEIELYNAVAPVLARLRSGQLRDLCGLGAQIDAVETRIAALPAEQADPDAGAEQFALDYPAGFLE